MSVSSMANLALARRAAVGRGLFAPIFSSHALAAK